MRFNLGHEELVGALEENVDVDREVLVGICEHEEVEELRVVQEEEASELEPLVLQVLVNLLLELQVVVA